MTDDASNRVPDDQLELYLDGQLSPNENVEIERRLSVDPNADREVKTQQAIDARLRANFSGRGMTARQIERLIENESDAIPSRSLAQLPWIRENRRLLVVATLTAALIAIISVSRPDLQPEIRPFFKPRSLVAIYNETVDQGFRPYYFCDDAERFAMTFAKRQQTPLILSDLPSDRSMVGLSYPGGMSRDTTAILCYADNQPVVLFVDRREFDNGSVAANRNNQNLYIHRKLLSDLVIYEVSPFPESKFTDSLKLAGSND